MPAGLHLLKKTSCKHLSGYTVFKRKRKKKIKRKDSAMLVLSRNKNEVIKIGDDIDITVISIGEKVRLEIVQPGSKVVESSYDLDEVIKIGDDIEVKITDIRGTKVRLGISCPPYISIHRKEVYDAMKRQPSGVASLAKNQ
jgi:carbon storage regulator